MAKIHIYQTGNEVYSKNLVVVFSETPDFFRTIWIIRTKPNILGQFQDKDTDFLFLKPNTKYDFYRIRRRMVDNILIVCNFI